MAYLAQLTLEIDLEKVFSSTSSKS